MSCRRTHVSISVTCGRYYRQSIHYLLLRLSSNQVRKVDVKCFRAAGREMIGGKRKEREVGRVEGLDSSVPELTPEKKRVLVITGPTAVGKTAASLRIAKMLQGEIISADSVQVYKGLDIGSAKITKDEMDGVPHHCIDILDPKDEFSAGLFHKIAMETIESIVARGKTPIVVGGTGFYLKWLVSGRPSTPASTKESEHVVQERLAACFEDKARAMGRASGDMLTPEEQWEVGVDLVRKLGDEETADRLLHQEVNNWYRMNRVVDILLQAPGKTLADLDAQDGGSPVYDFRCCYVTRNRVELYRRIDERVEIMLSDGLIKETVEKVSHVPCDSNCATRAIGYRQTLQFLQRMRTRACQDNGMICGDDIIQLAKEIQSASRKLCHRQMHWFRKEDAFHWIDASTGDPVGAILQIWDGDDDEDSDISLKKAGLTKEEEYALKTYQTVMTRLTPGSAELDKVVQEAKSVLDLFIHQSIE